jgi:hypothetical protein
MAGLDRRADAPERYRAAQELFFKANPPVNPGGSRERSYEVAW